MSSRELSERQTSRLEPNRRKRLLALAKKLRERMPDDPKAQKLARNLEVMARCLERRLN